MNNIQFTLVSIFCAALLSVSCAKINLDKEDYLANFKNRTGVCAEVAFKNFRSKMEEVNRLRVLNQTREADMKYREAYVIYHQNELDYINLQGRVGNVRIALSKQKQRLNETEDSAGKIAAAAFLKDAENMINFCKPSEADDLISKAQILLR
ncbi:MAG: hypothetical protein LBH05_01710 [Deferribacteraceae bacterium]|nr:hypothetical protein [Deferribacteraceae bacterium]